MIHEPWPILGLGLVLAHFICDYQAQADSVAIGKNYRISPYKTIPWYYWMTSHCAVHAAAVWVVTGQWWVGMLEFAAHFATDTWKCWAAGLDRPAPVSTLVHIDQGLHLLAKAVWVALLVLPA